MSESARPTDKSLIALRNSKRSSELFPSSSIILKRCCRPTKPKAPLAFISFLILSTNIIMPGSAAARAGETDTTAAFTIALLLLVVFLADRGGMAGDGREEEFRRFPTELAVDGRLLAVEEKAFKSLSPALLNAETAEASTPCCLSREIMPAESSALTPKSFFTSSTDCVPSGRVTNRRRLEVLAAAPSPPDMCQALRIINSKYSSLSMEALRLV